MVKQSTLKWYEHVRKMLEDRLAERVDQYVSFKRWITLDMGKVELYGRIGDGVRGIETAKRVCEDGRAWRNFDCGQSLLGRSVIFLIFPFF